MAENIVSMPTIQTVTITSTLLAILIAYLLTRLITLILVFISERSGQHRITVKMVIPLMKVLIYGFALYYILVNILKLESSQLIFFGGLLGAAIGFGLKDVFADIIGGLVITFEKPYQMGDKIRIGDYYGEVSDIGLRATKLVTPDDNLVSAPNYLIFNQAVASANAGAPEMMVVIDLFIDPSSDAVLAMKILKESVITSKYIYVSRKRSYTILLKDFPFYRRIRAKAYVNDLRFEFEFESDVTKRAWNEYKRNGIAAPELNILENPK